MIADTSENDPNIFCGSDDTDDFQEGTNSLGEYILKKLSLGKNGVAFVRSNGKTNSKVMKLVKNNFFFLFLVD